MLAGGRVPSRRDPADARDRRTRRPARAAPHSPPPSGWLAARGAHDLLPPPLAAPPRPGPPPGGGWGPGAGPRPPPPAPGARAPADQGRHATRHARRLIVVAPLS